VTLDRLAETKVTWWAHDDPRQRAFANPRLHVPARALGSEIRDLTDRSIARALEERQQRTTEAGQVTPEVWIFSRTKSDLALFAMREAKALGVRVLADWDDMFLGDQVRRHFVLHEGVDTVSVTRGELDYADRLGRAKQATIAETLRTADALIVSCEALAEAYADYNESIYVCPNQISPGSWPTLRKPDDGVFRVGFAGANEHKHDIHLIRETMLLASQQDGVEAVFLGWSPNDVASQPILNDFLTMTGQLSGRPRFASLQGLWEEVQIYERMWDFPIEVVPWTRDLNAHRRNLMSLDVGLCPGDDSTPFTPYRSDLKPLEYAMAGALPICSDARAFAGWEHHVPIADSPRRFRELVKWAIANRAEVRAQAAAVREHVLSERTIKRNLHRWQAAIAGDQSAAVERAPAKAPARRRRAAATSN
jgi:hypothetical protein